MRLIHCIPQPPIRYTFVFLVLVFFSCTAQAHGPRFKQIATTAIIAEDEHSEWSAQDIAANSYFDRFRAITDSIPNLGFTTSTFWIRLSLTNPHRTSHTYYLETARPLTNKVNLYHVEDQHAVLMHSGGDDLPFTRREVTYRKFVFPVSLEAGETKDLLFELGSDGEIITAPIKLWEADNFNAFVQRENLTMGFYFGLLLFVAGLFLFFASILRQRIYFYYASYVAFLFFMQASLDGLAYEYIWPQSPWMANHSILFFSGASVFTLMLYAGEFLGLNKMPRWFNLLFKGLMGLVLASALLSLTSGMTYQLIYSAMNALSLLALFAILGGIAWNQLNNVKVNIFFTIGFVAVLSGGIVFILTNFNIIYSDFLNQNAIKLGSAAEVTFLSIAMVSRYRDIQNEKEQAQQEAFEHLQEINRITSGQKERLEQEVKERTAEIREKNEELAEKNQEIIDSITYAKRIQTAILPPDRIVNEHLPNSFILYKPKDIVAGDFYWMETVYSNSPPSQGGEQKWVFFAAADCTGHGVPGAMVSVICVNGLNRSVREFELRDPAQILEKCRELVIKEFEKSDEEVKDGMDISLCALGPLVRSSSGAYRELKWAGANNPLWIVRASSASALEGPVLEEIKADKQPIGKYALSKPFTTHTAQLNEGDTIYLFSDGFPDQFGGEHGKKYKSGKFKRTLIELAEKPIDQQRELLDSEFENWRGRHEQIDDVCVMGVRV